MKAKDVKLAPLSGLQIIAVILLLVAFFLQTVPNISALSVASDESPHLVAGYTYLTTGDFRLNPQHPPFAKELAALPLLAFSPTLNFSWPGRDLSALDEWTFGGYFLFKNDANTLLFWARLPIVLLGALLCLTLFFWARRWYGTEAGLIALLFAAFCPLFLAHACFVTTDIALTLFWSLTLYSLWRFLESENKIHLTICALSFGLALGSKFSAVVLAPVLPLLLFFGFCARGITISYAIRSTLFALLFIGAGAFIVVQLLYAASLDPFIYVKGLAKVNADHRPTYPSYLLGEFKVGGFWYYFLVAFLVKTPLALLIAAVGGSCFRATALLLPSSPVRSRGSATLQYLFLCLPAFAIILAASLGTSNFGVRYILPAYVPLIIFAAGALARLRKRIFVAVLLAWYVGTSVIAYPDHLAYFNELIGGSKNGHLVLDDSNIEWGQDLKRLKSYMDRHNIEKVRLLYPWSGLPSYYGISTQPMSKSDWEEAPSPGVYAISTHALVRGLWSAKVNGVKSDWLLRYKPQDRIGYSFWIFRFPER